MSRNMLDAETSPYLLQHKDNPVHWRVWSEATLDLAKRENKPILLSVGYAACHWCHVMAHESFESPETAAVMNELFVNVKVDREERPDLDAIYQAALAMLGQQGGWPLTMFLTPDGEPFWGGTYFPPETRWGRPGFVDVLRQVAQTHAASPDRIQNNVTAIQEALGRLSSPTPGDPPTLDSLTVLAHQSMPAVDPIWGGLAGAPKFPQPFYFRFLWRAWQRSQHPPFASVVIRTLDRMCEGGIYDHLGGGFARYATDDEWLVPHFEKMLYDNAQLIDLLREVWLETRAPRYRRRIEETVDWVLREMVADGGGFASSLDADSEGEEGLFYVWSEAEIDAVLAPLGEETIARFKIAYDVSPHGNWEGKTILNRRRHIETWDEAEEAILEPARQRLFNARAPRVRPSWDDKVLVDWNGLMIAALADAAAAFDRPDWRAAAERAYTFVRTRMTDGDRLLHAARNGVSAHPATLEDYANMARAALALAQSGNAGHYLDHAESWMGTIEKHYRCESGGYYLSADDTPGLITRTMTGFDNAVPGGNGTLVEVLARLHYLTGKTVYADRAEAVVRAFGGQIPKTAIGFATMLNGWELLLDGRQIVVVGDPDDEDTAALLGTAHRSPAGPKIIQQVTDPSSLPVEHPAHGKPAGDSALAYVCRGRTCSLPLRDADSLRAALTEG